MVTGLNPTHRALVFGLQATGLNLGLANVQRCSWPGERHRYFGQFYSDSGVFCQLLGRRTDYFASDAEPVYDLYYEPDWLATVLVTMTAQSVLAFQVRLQHCMVTWG